jgi:hypothetical protein
MVPVDHHSNYSIKDTTNVETENKEIQYTPTRLVWAQSPLKQKPMSL